MSLNAPTATSICVAISAVVGMAGVAIATTELRADEPALGDRFLRSVVAQTTRSGLAIRSMRELRAGTVSGKHEAWMTVQTSATPAGTFSWEVVTEGGSNRTREKVLRAVLDTEAASWRAAGHDSAALTPENYRLTRLPATRRPGQVEIQLKPRREDPRLIDGILTVDPDGYPLELEGVLAKRPSFWVKSVRVVKRYGRFAGVALPTSVESHADLKLFGKSTFTMRYRYLEVNGRVFPGVLTAELTPP
jgi:hypothetical protein